MVDSYSTFDRQAILTRLVWGVVSGGNGIKSFARSSLEPEASHSCSDCKQLKSLCACRGTTKQRELAIVIDAVKDLGGALPPHLSA